MWSNCAIPENTRIWISCIQRKNIKVDWLCFYVVVMTLRLINLELISFESVFHFKSVFPLILKARYFRDVDKYNCSLKCWRFTSVSRILPLILKILNSAVASLTTSFSLYIVYLCVATSTKYFLHLLQFWSSLFFVT